MERMQRANITIQAPAPAKTRVETALPRDRATKAAQRIEKYRQTMGWLVLAFWTASVLGQDWDANWHAIVGRDGFWTPPHWMFYSTVTIAGVICAVVVLTETWLYYRGKAGVTSENSTPILFFFRGPVGFALAGFGMVVMLISAPFDDYYHRIYGIDVQIWTPFHVMLVLGIIMANLGVVYLLASLINRRLILTAVPASSNSNQPLSRVVAYLRPLFQPLTLGLILATILLMTRYMALMLETFFGGEGVGNLAIGSLKLPAASLTLASLPLLFVMLNLFTRRIGAATLAGLLYVAWRWLDGSFTDWGIQNMALERGIASRNTLTGTLLNTGKSNSFLLMALVIDGVFLLGWAWSKWRKPLPALAMAVLASLAGGVTLFLLEHPWETFNQVINSLINSSGNAFGAGLFLRGLLFTPDYWAALPLVLIIAALGGLVGTALAVSLRYTDR